jgi:hypothetical protein
MEKYAIFRVPIVFSVAISLASPRQADVTSPKELRRKPHILW